MTVHFIPVHQSERAACGRNVEWAHQRAEAPRIQAVDCGRCTVTEAYKAALALSQQMVRRSDADQMIRFEVQRVLDLIARRVNDWADESGLCSTFDEAVEEINCVLPAGYTFAKRKQRFSISVHTYEVMASDEDEARAMVEEDPWSFIDVSE